MLRLALASVALVASLAPDEAVASGGALRPAVTTRGSYGESFTVVADLDDGTYVQLSLGFTNIGPGSLKAICRAVVVPPGATPWRASTRVGRDGWSWSDPGGERLAIGPCSASVQDGGTVVEVPLEGGSVRLRLSGAPVRRIPADAAFTLGDDYYRTEVMLVGSRVDGTVQLPGGPARTVAGGGYLDHMRSTIQPKEMADRWVRFRALRGGRGLVLLARRGHDGRFAPAWMCDPPGGRCRHFSSFSLERSGPAATPSFRVDLASELEPVQIVTGRLLYRDDPMSELGVVGKLATPFFGAPVTYVHRARLVGRGGEPIEGVLEVELSHE